MGFKDGGVPYYYLRNLQGDVIGITDATGAIVVEYTYDAWGNVLSITGSHAGWLGTLNPIRYRGYYYDAETGYYFLRTRYYNPEWRRFLNADGLFVAGEDQLNGSNMYAYCNGNPIMLSDPSGMAAKSNLIVWLLLETDLVLNSMLGILGGTYNGFLVLAMMFMDNEVFEVAATVASEVNLDPAMEKRAVANVIVNRLYDKTNNVNCLWKSIDTLHGIISQSGQFGYDTPLYKSALSFYKNGGSDYKGRYTSCLRQTAYVLYGIVGDNTNGSVSFNSNDPPKVPDGCVKAFNKPSGWEHTFYKWK